MIKPSDWGQTVEPSAVCQSTARRHTRSFVWAIMRSSFAVLSISFACPSAAQETRLNAPSTPASQSHEYLGVDRCRSCHREPTPDQLQAGVTDFVLLNESAIWVDDIHSKAFELIDPATSELGKQICDKLGIADIHQSRECLSCHSDWRAGLTRPPTYQRGVACESCHGASQDWDIPHSKDTWRATPVAAKAELGMIDVRNPIERAEQCFGCHIGSAAQGKVITHEMYAAGHPPLPSIEIESFAQQMPRHWRYLGEKIAEANSKSTGAEAAAPFAFFDEFVRENHRYLRLDEARSQQQILEHNHRAAAVVLGGVMALRESIDLLRDLAGNDLAAKNAWPELAAFDCRDCHHELATPSWRQEQRTGSVPGRPVISRWPTALVRLAIRHVSTDRTSYDQRLAKLEAKLGAVQSELQHRPFGRSARVHDACAELSEWLTSEVVEPVAAKPFDDRAVADAVNVLIVIGSTERHDYDSARQIGWALRSLTCGLSQDDRRAATINRRLDRLAPQLRLNLTNGTSQPCRPITVLDESRKLTPLATELGTQLAAAVAYDSAWFRNEMQTLRELLR